MRCRLPDRLLLKLSHSSSDGQQSCPGRQLYPDDVADAEGNRPRAPHDNMAFTRKAYEICNIVGEARAPQEGAKVRNEGIVTA